MAKQTHRHMHSNPTSRRAHTPLPPPRIPPRRTFSMSFIGSSLWCLQNSITLASTLFLTLGSGISCVSVLSSSRGERVEGKRERVEG